MVPPDLSTDFLIRPGFRPVPLATVAGNHHKEALVAEGSRKKTYTIVMVILIVVLALTFL